MEILAWIPADVLFDRPEETETCTMRKLAGMALLLIGTATVALAFITAVPEIDPGSAASAVALLTGAALVIRGRRRN